MPVSWCSAQIVPCLKKKIWLCTSKPNYMIHIKFNGLIELFCQYIKGFLEDGDLHGTIMHKCFGDFALKAPDEFFKPTKCWMLLESFPQHWLKVEAFFLWHLKIFKTLVCCVQKPMGVDGCCVPILLDEEAVEFESSFFKLTRSRYCRNNSERFFFYINKSTVCRFMPNLNCTYPKRNFFSTDCEFLGKYLFYLLIFGIWEFDSTIL